MIRERRHELYFLHSYFLVIVQGFKHIENHKLILNWRTAEGRYCSKISEQLKPDSRHVATLEIYFPKSTLPPALHFTISLFVWSLIGTNKDALYKRHIFMLFSFSKLSLLHRGGLLKLVYSSFFSRLCSQMSSLLMQYGSFIFPLWFFESTNWIVFERFSSKNIFYEFEFQFP